MLFMKLYLELINKTNSSSLKKYYKIIDILMHSIDINNIDELSIKEIYDKLNVLTFDKSTAVSNGKFMSLIAPFKAKKMNMRLCFKGGHTAIYNATEQRPMPIASAREFCSKNDISFEDYFIINKKYQHYSAEVKQCVKNCIIRVFDYAVEQQLIERNISRIKYHFFDSNVRVENVLYKEEIDLFVCAIFKEKTKTMLIIILYFLSNFDNEFVVNIQKKNINYEKKIIKVINKEIMVPDYILDELKYYCIDKKDDDYLFGFSQSRLRNSSIRKYIYETRKKIKIDKITISLLRIYYEYLLESILQYCSNNEMTMSQAILFGVKDEDEYLEYLEYLKIIGGN